MQNTATLLKEAKANHVFEQAACVIGYQNQRLFQSGDAKALYDLASLTKVVSTTLITLRYVQSGKLSLADALVDFFDEVPAEKQDIRLLDLMTHSSGLPAFYSLENACESSDDVVNQILHAPLAYEPKTSVIYSCIGYILLGKILEKVGHASLDELFVEEVAKPLGLSQTTYKPNKGTIVKTSPTLEVGLVHDPNAQFLGGVSGNAGLFSNLEDLTRVANMLANNGTIDDVIYLNERMMKLAISNLAPHDATHRGLGFDLKGDVFASCGDLFAFGSFGHTGFTGTSLWIDLEHRLYVVLLTNRVYYGDDHLDIIKFRRHFHNAIMNDFYHLQRGGL